MEACHWTSRSTTAMKVPCYRVLTSNIVDASVAHLLGNDLIEVWIHRGTRGYGKKCCAGIGKRLTAVRMQDPNCKIGWQVLRQLMVAISMYDSHLALRIRGFENSGEESDEAFTVGPSAFFGCSRLTAVVIPDGVTTIGSFSFAGCSSLTSIIIPDSVTSIDTDAFAGCSSLTSVIIPDSVKFIGSNAFAECRGLTTVNLPQSTAIDDTTFLCCAPDLVVTRRDDGHKSVPLHAPTCALVDCAASANVHPPNPMCVQLPKAAHRPVPWSAAKVEKELRALLYTLYADRIVQQARRSERMFGRRPGRKPPIHKCFLNGLKQVPPSELRACATPHDLLARSGLRTDVGANDEAYPAMQRVLATAAWWLRSASRGGPTRSWCTTLWRALRQVAKQPRDVPSYGSDGVDAGIDFTFTSDISGVQCSGRVVPVTSIWADDLAYAGTPRPDQPELAMPLLAEGRRRLFHGTTAGRASSFIETGASTGHVDSTYRHDFGPAFYASPQLTTSSHFAMMAATCEGGDRGDRDDDPAILVLDVDIELFEGLNGFAFGDCSVEGETRAHWERVVGHFLRGTQLADDDPLCARGFPVITGPMCDNGDDATGDGVLPSPNKGHSQVAFPSNGMDFISPGRAGTGVCAVHVIRARMNDADALHLTALDRC